MYFLLGFRNSLRSCLGIAVLSLVFSLSSPETSLLSVQGYFMDTYYNDVFKGGFDMRCWELGPLVTKETLITSVSYRNRIGPRDGSSVFGGMDVSSHRSNGPWLTSRSSDI